MFINPIIAAEFSLDADNKRDGSIIVNFNVLVEPQLQLLKKDRQQFSYFKNLTEFNRSVDKGMPEILSKEVPLAINPDFD